MLILTASVRAVEEEEEEEENYSANAVVSGGSGGRKGLKFRVRGLGCRVHAHANLHSV
jgi:hypothetical protein